MSGRPLLLLTLVLSSAPLGAQGPVPGVLERNGFPVFISGEQISAALTSNSQYSFAESYSSSPRHKRNAMEELDAQLRALAGKDVMRCSPAVPQPLPVDEVWSRSILRRVHLVPASFIGTVEAMTAGWASEYVKASQLATIRIEVKLSDGFRDLKTLDRLHVLIPYGTISIGDDALCTERGAWPMVGPGSRVLVNGVWEKAAPDAVVSPTDLAVIEQGLFLPTRLPELDFHGIASEAELLERLTEVDKRPR